MSVLARHRSTVDKHLEAVLDQSDESCRCLVNMVDMDNFKLINDTYGHETGDQVLIHLAKIFSGMVREQDKVVRWGGDEFLFIVKIVSAEEAPKLIHRLHNAMTTYDWAKTLKAPDLKVFISSGYTFSNGKESRRDILWKTDLNLYTAKQNGRNQAIGG